MNNVTINADVIKELVAEKAMEIVLQIQEDLSREDAIIEKEGVLEKINYDTVIEEDEDVISIVPTFDNRIDEYSNSKTIVETGFEGNMTLTKMKNKLT